ncbi:MAG: 6-phosphofructokinase [Anaerolineae bacterium]|nr:6-phosphofructokinase [Anaerolineae bacterium]MDW8172147.1 6-phosphofructokinase [Anaerolineae bacterium]
MRTLIVVSGGDAPGINVALAQFVQDTQQSEGEAWGAIGGLPALVQGQWRALSPADLWPYVGLAGSILPSSREPILRDESAQAQARRLLRERGVDSVLLFGGDGTLRYVLPLLLSWGLPCVAIPTTIDNDVPDTDYTLGFDSACNYAYQAVDGVLATAHALGGRIFMLETLGGPTGYLALAVAHGAGAHAVLLPEYAYEQDWLAARLRAAAQAQGFALLVLSEGVAEARTLADTLAQRVGMRVRDVRLGHAQRGATPSHRDRTFARQAARLAHQAVRAGQSGIVVQRGAGLELVASLSGQRPAPDRALYDQINGL